MAQNYQLVIRIPYEAMDDVQARQMAKVIMKGVPVSKETVVKLQRLRKGKEPTKVKM